MKTVVKILLVLIVTFEQHKLFGQCEIDAGYNRNICPSETNSGAKLFGKVISGDPINFIWESYYFQPSLNKSYYASSMLSDTTVLQPSIEQHFERSVKYFLTGITATGETCRDSVQLNFSDWMFLTVDKITGKSTLDTIELWIAAESNWPHMKYEWSPNFMISDTTIRNPRVWNDKTVFYNLEITDTLGCKVTDDIFEVYVQPTSTKSFEKVYVEIYPNPFQDQINIQSEIGIKKLEVYDLQGLLVKQSSTNRINFQDENEGIYIVRIEFINGNFLNRKIIKFRNTP
jgi:hypothetical protein